MARSSSNSLLQRELLDTIKELRAVIEDLRKELAANHCLIFLSEKGLFLCSTDMR